MQQPRRLRLEDSRLLHSIRQVTFVASLANEVTRVPSYRDASLVLVASPSSSKYLLELSANRWPSSSNSRSCSTTASDVFPQPDGANVCRHKLQAAEEVF